MELKFNTVYQLCDTDTYSIKKEYNFFFTLDPKDPLPNAIKSKNKQADEKIYGFYHIGGPDFYLNNLEKKCILTILDMHKNEYTFKGRKYQIFYDFKGIGILDKIKNIYFVDVEHKMDELLKQLKEFNDRFSRIMFDEEIESIRQKPESQEGSLPQNDKQGNDLTNELKKEIDELKNKLVQETKENYQLRSKVQECEKTLEHQQTKHHFEIIKFEKDIQNIRSKLSNQAKENNELRSKIQEYEKSLKNKQTKQDYEIIQLKRDIERLTFNLDNKTKENDELKMKMREQQANHDNEKAKIENFIEQKDQIESQIASKANEIRELKEENMLYDRKLTQEQLKVIDLKNQIKQLESQQNKLASQLERKTKENKELEEKVLKYEDEREEQEQQISKLSDLEKQIRGQNDDLKSQLTIQKKEFEELQQKIHQINEKDKNESKEQDSFHRRQKTMKILDEEYMATIEKGDQIGNGTCGIVSKVFIKQERALKELNKECNNYDDLRHLVNEYETMNILNHPSILKVYGIFFGNEEEPPSILLDYCPTNLENEIIKKSLSKVQKVCFIYQIANGMKYIHLNQIIHRDLKPSDILIDYEGQIKISDFGMSKLLSPDDFATTINVGTANFMSPEIMIGEDEYTEKVDVYSFGVLIYFILSDGQMPSIKPFDVCKGKKAKIPESFTEFARSLIDSCWNFEASDRPSFKEICDQMDKNNYSVLNLSKIETRQVSDFINEYKESLPSYSI